MKLKTRLGIAFLIILCVPFLMFIVVFWGFTKHQVRVFEDNYGVSVPVEALSDSMQVIGKSTQQTFEKLKQQAKTNPDRFLDESFLNQINRELADKSSYLLVRKDREQYYSGSEDDVTKLFQELPKFREFSSAPDGGSYIGKDVRAFVKQLDMEFMDGSQEVCLLFPRPSGFWSRIRD